MKNHTRRVTTTTPEMASAHPISVDAEKPERLRTIVRSCSPTSTKTVAVMRKSRMSQTKNPCKRVRAGMMLGPRRPM